MQNEFKGFHGEWNLGSPGGWEYQRMVQKIYQPAWEEIKKLTKIDLEIDLQHRMFQPSLKFADLLVEKSRKMFPKQKPFILIMAEEETLEDVVENKRFVQMLSEREGVDSQLVGPQELELKNENLSVDGKKPTAIFIDFNTSVLVELEEKHSITPIVEAIKMDIVVNPKGMEAINSKEIFEPVSDPASEAHRLMSETTKQLTPWTRIFFERKTAGPDGEEIDLVSWARENPEQWVLKPGSGWSGKGIFVGPQLKDDPKQVEEAVETALTSKKWGRYIIQQFVPLEVWSERIPMIDAEKEKVALRERQTDFRCLISSAGVVGFLARFGGVPTNVGSGGGVQALAVIESGHSTRQAADMLNDAILKLPLEKAKKLRKMIDDGAMGMDFKYLNGPIPIGLRPRMISHAQMEALRTYGKNLYADTLKLEQLWQEGKLKQFIQISEREKQIIKLQPRKLASTAMMASDGLFDFGAGLSPLSS